MDSKKSQKIAKDYCCLICHYSSCNKTDYSKHLATDKHKNKANGSEMVVNDSKKSQKIAKNIYTCKCGKKYKYDSGYYRHKKKCVETKEVNTYTNDKELIMMLVKQNSELLEVIKSGTHNTTISHNTNSLNKTFNLQFFLNETCKDAMNIMEFVDSIKLQLPDLEKVGEIGYVEGISNIITTNLKALDVTQRPIHCTDKKRETLYIKDENKWEKENEEKKKIRKVIKKVAKKNIMLLQKFKEAHPDCGKSASKFSDQYNKIIIESMDTDKENEDKIIKNISNNVTIDKECDK